MPSLLYFNPLCIKKLEMSGVFLFVCRFVGFFGLLLCLTVCIAGSNEKHTTFQHNIWKTWKSPKINPKGEGILFK